MSAGASRNARLPEVQVQEPTHAGVAPSAPARYNRLIHFEGRSSVVEQRPFKPKVVGSIPTAPTKLLSYQHIKRLFLFQLELLFQLNDWQCAPSILAATAE